MKIAVCTPCHGSPKSPFAESLGQLLIESAKRLPGVDFELRIRGLSNLPLIRTVLADWAIGWGADYILFVDADQVFPRTALADLVAHEKPIIGANIARRTDPSGPTAGKLLSDRVEWAWTTKELADQGVIEEVDFLGFGLVLIRADVFRTIPKPWFVMKDNGGGEDYFFCGAAKRQGIRMFVDHSVSWKTGHLHEVILTMESTHADRKRFEAAQADAPWAKRR